MIFSRNIHHAIQYQNEVIFNDFDNWLIVIWIITVMNVLSNNNRILPATCHYKIYIKIMSE